MEVGTVRITLVKRSELPKMKLGEHIEITINNNKTRYVISQLSDLDDDKLQIILSPDT